MAAKNPFWKNMRHSSTTAEIDPPKARKIRSISHLVPIFLATGTCSRCHPFCFTMRISALLAALAVGLGSTTVVSAFSSHHHHVADKQQQREQLEILTAVRLAATLGSGRLQLRARKQTLGMRSMWTI